MEPEWGVAAVATVYPAVPPSAVSEPTSRPMMASRRSLAVDAARRPAPRMDPISTTQRSQGNQLASRPSNTNDQAPLTAIIAARTTRTTVFARPRHSSRPEIATTAAMDGASATA